MGSSFHAYCTGSPQYIASYSRMVPLQADALRHNTIPPSVGTYEQACQEAWNENKDKPWPVVF